MVCFIGIEYIFNLLLRDGFALVDLFLHGLPIFFLASSLGFAAAVAGPVGWEVAKAVVFEVESYFELVVVASWNFYILSFEFEFGLSFEEVEIIVDSGYSFAAWPAAWIQLDEDIGHKDAIAFLDPLIELKFLVDEFLSSSASYVDVIVIRKTLMSYSFQSIAN